VSLIREYLPEIFLLCQLPLALETVFQPVEADAMDACFVGCNNCLSLAFVVYCESYSTIQYQEPLFEKAIVAMTRVNTEGLIESTYQQQRSSSNDPWSKSYA
jgi:hypothetical protein